MPQDTVDFRSRVAAERRDRMRARLLAATMEVFGRKGGGRGAVIDDVVQAAGVSRGAFYRHFQSLDEALVELTSDLLGEIIATAGAVFADVSDPVLGAALGSELLLYRAGMDRPWGRFVASTNLILGDPALIKVLQNAIRAGGAAGVFKFSSLTAATDVALGGLLAGVRRLAEEDGPPGPYVMEVSLMLLRSLAAREADAAAAVAAANARIAEIGPSQLPWWRAG